MEILPIGTVHVMLPRYSLVCFSAPFIHLASVFFICLTLSVIFFAFVGSYGDHYEWNKVTTCIHNILSGRRWIEHYGEVTIRNTATLTASANSPLSRYMLICNSIYITNG